MTKQGTDISIRVLATTSIYVSIWKMCSRSWLRVGDSLGTPKRTIEKMTKKGKREISDSPCEKGVP